LRKNKNKHRYFLSLKSPSCENFGGDPFLSLTPYLHFQFFTEKKKTLFSTDSFSRFDGCSTGKGSCRLRLPHQASLDRR